MAGPFPDFSKPEGLPTPEARAVKAARELANVIESSRRVDATDAAIVKGAAFIVSFVRMIRWAWDTPE